MGRDPAQQKRGRRQARGADDDVGLRGESTEIRRDLHLSSIGLQLHRELPQQLAQRIRVLPDGFRGKARFQRGDSHFIRQRAIHARLRRPILESLRQHVGQ